MVETILCKDYIFLQTGYCSTYVDPKWRKSHLRKQTRDAQAKASKAKSGEEIFNMSNPVVLDDSDKEELASDNDCQGDDQCDYIPKPDVKKGKYELNPKSNNDDMPDKYCHVRLGERKVREEIYTVMHHLSSKYHMSKRQIEGSIITIANMLFGRNWKPIRPREVLTPKLCQV